MSHKSGGIYEVKVEDKKAARPLHREKPFKDVNCEDYYEKESENYASINAWLQAKCEDIVGGNYTSVTFWLVAGIIARPIGLVLHGVVHPHYIEIENSGLETIVAQLLSKPHQLRTLNFIYNHTDEMPSDRRKGDIERIIRPAIEDNPRQLATLGYNRQPIGKTWENVEIEDPPSSLCVML